MKFRSLSQVRQFVHVLDEWAKLAPDTNGSVFGSGWLSHDRSDLPYFPPMQKTSGFSIGLFTGLAWRISAGFVGPLKVGFLHTADFWRIAQMSGLWDA